MNDSNDFPQGTKDLARLLGGAFRDQVPFLRDGLLKLGWIPPWARSPGSPHILLKLSQIFVGTRRDTAIPGSQWAVFFDPRPGVHLGEVDGARLRVEVVKLHKAGFSFPRRIVVPSEAMYLMALDKRTDEHNSRDNLDGQAPWKGKGTMSVLDVYDQQLSDGRISKEQYADCVFNHRPPPQFSVDLSRPGSPVLEDSSIMEQALIHKFIQSIMKPHLFPGKKDEACMPHPSPEDCLLGWVGKDLQLVDSGYPGFSTITGAELKGSPKLVRWISPDGLWEWFALPEELIIRTQCNLSRFGLRFDPDRLLNRKKEIIQKRMDEQKRAMGIPADPAIRTNICMGTAKLLPYGNLLWEMDREAKESK